MTFLWIITVSLTFVFMEFVAWFSHKYIMHGFLWSLHKDHHLKDHKSWFERNDFFFIFYALSVINVALACGFASPSHFSKCYRAHYDTTPYRERGAQSSRLAQ